MAEAAAAGPLPVLPSTAVPQPEWPGYDKYLSVEKYLDRNKLLINEINANHERKTPEGLTRNVVLIHELNANIGKVVALYRDLSTSFLGVLKTAKITAPPPPVQQQQAPPQLQQQQQPPPPPQAQGPEPMSQ